MEPIPNQSPEVPGQDDEQDETLKRPIIQAASKQIDNEPSQGKTHKKLEKSQLAKTSEEPRKTLYNSNTLNSKRGKILIIMLLLVALLWQATQLGATQFLSTQGWGYVLGNSINTTDNNLFLKIGKQIQHASRMGTRSPSITPQQYIDMIVQQMTLDQKLGQMMFVQFTGSSYSLDVSTMVSQYDVGAVIIFSANGNIINAAQLKNLTQQIHNNSPIPPAIAIDQEGGYVNRLLNLNGARPAAATIGATNDPAKATEAGIQDAQDLSGYGINLNLAPVVDIDSSPYSELHQDLRTYSSDPNKVTKMASAYLQGLQQSGKVVGTLKHFPGLGNVIVDPHRGVPRLNRTKDQLEQIDWAPYRQLIQQGSVHAIMVTHELVPALDDARPSSLSVKIVRGILRDEMGFQGVIMTDSLTMTGITDYYPPAQSAALSVEAGCDLLMGAGSPNEVAAMINGLKEAINTGAISQQRINDSVRRILMMKYAMGLFTISDI